MKIALLGAGAWGTALAMQLRGGAEVTLWTRNPEQAERMVHSGTNDRYLPGSQLAGLDIQSDLSVAIRAADYLIAAVPTSGYRDLLRQLRGHGAAAPLIWLCKGFETGTMKLPHEVLAEEWPEHADAAALSGPSFAQEVAAGQPVALTVASLDAEFARQVARDLHRLRMRLYSSNDLIGVEVGGAVKNVIAIAAGISDGLGFGLNARAALITRGLAEIARLGLRLGGRLDTFMGLSGMGDLILTCTGDLSRNRQVGLKLAQGESLEGILRELGHVAEGVTTAREVARLAREMNVDMPIAEAVRGILEQEQPPKEAVAALLNRDIKDE
ncbi:MAG: glycerol-3-phosphate dehydrogenase [Hydrogenophilales bacterium CG03_land_8_20_14_0_80_62_28]|nr:NAD(P)-dependent glycerol-3-phosphate dehydrogenase [Betaproteobacteria bacterium]PIV23500.1 MAG: glycerol-3-phosphate dehydrogenase [Hydrogenophilales bacterium CG03_land_8_20_14_0_80_62_28]PIW38796.1 MAG: glycerol-3-phosphate dehydrogenase [Hydrogenophilales bacterium CG15_BIG_FIL_POST_REV_8_21_14_020_62_31]PIW71703.1 MAG: glycerol-3-phosphate dehydrogenase [Hydrogenophilales bacterium CG12_big_fil_rev_8_21_14_0_65_61_21]PIX00715.1 MAG: glycerol-3-phosphate dehydrogenase [Hydrogenophilales